MKNIGIVTIYNDNQGAGKLCSDQTMHSKHIDVKYHQIREWIERKIMCVEYLPEEMIADVFTKGLTASKHRLCIRGIGMESDTSK